MSKMVDRVALAIDECLTARVKRGDADQVFRLTTTEEVARAVIAAMREPLEEMLRAGMHSDAGNCLSSHWPNARDGRRCVWRAMIDAALK